MKFSGNLVSILVAGSFVGGLSAQELSHVDLSRASTFGLLAEAFTNDINSLFQGPGSLYTQFTFGWDGSDPLTGTLIQGINPTGQPVELEFTQIANPLAFATMRAMPVAYVGNENGDNNVFGYVNPTGPNAGLIGLYNYKKGVNNPGAVDDPNSGSNPEPTYSKPSVPDLISETSNDYSLLDGSNPTEGIVFWHENLSQGTGVALSSDPDRFAVFEANTAAGGRYYLLGVDDRLTFDIDYDDGFFLVQVAIPEPSSIGLLGVALLVGLGVTRRSRRKTA